jgi:hypothetical protein
MLDSYPHDISLVTGMRETEALLEPSNQRRFVRAAVAHKSRAELLQAGLDCDPVSPPVAFTHPPDAVFNLPI